jgi:putative adhesin
MKRIGFVAASASAWMMTTAVVLTQGDGNRVAVPFSDPSRPGTVKVNLILGGIRVTASTGKDVVVITDDTIVTTREGRGITVPQRPETAGLRRLTPRSGLRIEEQNNVMSISSGRYMGGEHVTIQVPVRTNLNLSTVNGAGIRVEGIDGEIEVTSVNGEIQLTDVAGTVVAHATNGTVRVTLRQVTPEKPMSFTSFNGNVDVTLPAAVRANLKLRSDQGEVYTDFEVPLQQQRTASTSVQVPPVPPAPPALPVSGPNPPPPSPRPLRGRRGTRVEVDTSIYGTVNGGGPEFELRTFNGDVYLRKGK